MLVLLLLLRVELADAVDRYVESLASLAKNRYEVVQMVNQMVKPLIVTWQIELKTFEQAKDDFVKLFNDVMGKGADIFAFAIQTDIKAEPFTGSRILHRLVDTVRMNASKYNCSGVVAQKYGGIVVFANEKVGAVFSTHVSDIVASSEMVGVELSGSNTKIGFINSNFRGVADHKEQVLLIIKEFELSSQATDRSDENDFASILWVGDFNTGIVKTTWEGLGTTVMTNADKVGQNRKNLDSVAMNFSNYWPTNCHDDGSNIAPTFGYVNGILTRSLAPGWPSKVIVYENAVEHERRLVECRVVDYVLTGAHKPLLAMYQIYL